MEQLKILEIINRWGYLNIYQIAMLLNKDVGTVDTLVRILTNKKLLRVDQLTRKNIYMLSSLGNRKLGKESKSIRINYNELQHQDLLIQ
ncbi:MAG: BlaI/MecI/CopY family transcriptional regulator [Spiroplasma ixodetis]|nr:BlaI/MecI/CopY family transcriptional regulator [Spiroplasma ixodetis]MBP1526813.1 BlaI/MecI/CopY family transcriptional regulator [Spiroplasma ixodetis]